VTGCENVRCPKCDTEFQLHKVNITPDRQSTRDVSQHFSRLMKKYYEDFGESPNR